VSPPLRLVGMGVGLSVGGGGVEGEKQDLGWERRVVAHEGLCVVAQSPRQTRHAHNQGNGVRCGSTAGLHEKVSVRLCTTAVMICGGGLVVAPGGAHVDGGAVLVTVAWVLYRFHAALDC